MLLRGLMTSSDPEIPRDEILLASPTKAVGCDGNQ
jgi:hypothetical protein